jgi:hypothetical protein
MIVLAIFGTIAAAVWSVAVLFANGMRSSPGDFQGAWMIWAAWTLAAVLWLVWWFK